MYINYRVFCRAVNLLCLVFHVAWTEHPEFRDPRRHLRNRQLFRRKTLLRSVHSYSYNLVVTFGYLQLPDHELFSIYASVL